MAKTAGDAAQEVAEAAADKAQEVAEEAETMAPAALADHLAVGKGFRLEDVDPRSTPGFDGDKAAGKAALAAGAEKLSTLQERLFAEGTAGGTRSVLLVVQGMDTSGKGGVMRHVMGSVDPQGVHLRSFKAPTDEEREHDFLWRIERALPRPGLIGVFDRSHYEDVLIARVRSLVPVHVVDRRYEEINAWERRVTEAGTTMVKVMLHISNKEQKSRLAERLDRPDKYWKYNPGDVDERLRWHDYQEAYQLALQHCSTEAAPWYVVPADRKWFARWAVQQLLLDTLTGLDPQWPPADFDVEAEKARLAAS